MKNRTTLFISGILIFHALLISCTTFGKPVHSSRVVQHIVICWLKEPNSLEARKTLIEKSKDLSHIPGVLSVKAGEVLPSHRNIVDSSFDVALIISFQNQDALKTYVTHPIHKKLLKDVVEPLVQRVLVYDMIEGVKP